MLSFVVVSNIQTIIELTISCNWKLEYLCVISIGHLCTDFFSFLNSIFLVVVFQNSRRFSSSLSSIRLEIFDLFYSIPAFP